MYKDDFSTEHPASSADLQNTSDRDGFASDLSNIDEIAYNPHHIRRRSFASNLSDTDEIGLESIEEADPISSLKKRFDFDEVVDRKNSDSVKYGAGAPSGKTENLLPLWVADMDFRVPDPVIDALSQRVQHGIFGYGAADEKYYDAVCRWFDTHFHANIDPRWIVRTPGVVFALSAALRAFTSEGDAVLINRPVYYPFSRLIDGLGRKLVNSPLKLNGTRYEIDFADFEQKIVENDVKLYILCSPHNPVGRVWTKEELTNLADICLEHDVLIVSDEIHCDFVWSEHPHTMFTTLGEEYLGRCMVCTAPSKTFNLAGLNASNIIIPDRTLRKKFRICIENTGASSTNVMGFTACRAAYEEGLPWLTELKAYLSENIRFIDSYLSENIPQVRLIRPEGTYLLWLDMRDLGLSEEELEHLMTDAAGLWLDGGGMFGPEGVGFQRLNAACPRSVLEKAMHQLREAVLSLSPQR